MGSPFKRLKEVYARTYSLDTGRDADFFDCVNDIYFSPEVQSLKKYPQHDKMDRLQHITSVAYLTFRVCRHFGLDYRKAARAATMHDLFYYDWHENADKPRGNGSFARGQILRIERDENSKAERERMISGAGMNRSTKEREAL